MINTAILLSTYNGEKFLSQQLDSIFNQTYRQFILYIRDDGSTDNTLEIVFASDTRRTIEFVRDKLSFPFTIGTSVSFFKSQTHEGIYYLEVRRSGSSKGKAMQRLLKYLRIKENRTAVLGDWYNDLSMFETKAMKVALKNAIPELKKAADYVLKKSNNEEGVTEFLEALLKAKVS